MERNPVGWFEIPVNDMDRAIAFYEKIGFELSRNQLGPLDMAWFPMYENAPGSTGSLVKHESYVPSEQGVLIYFTTPSGNLDEDCKNVESAGGEVLQTKKSIGEHGFIALCKDTEGNRIAFHSRT